MNTQGQRIIGVATVGLFLAALMLVLWPTAIGRAGSDAPHVSQAGRGAIANPTLPDRLELAPSHTTFIIQYQGQAASPELMLALANLETAGQISALDAASAPGRMFVLGERQALLALRDLSGVVAITDAQSADEPLTPAGSPQLVEENPEQDLGEASAELSRALGRAVRESESQQIRESDAILKTSQPALEPTLRTWMPNTQSPISNPQSPIPNPHFYSDAPLASRSIYADGYITGVVTADDGGAPLANVGIVAVQDSPYIYEYETTDANGVYTISVPPGVYQITFYPPDYHISEYYDDVPMTNSSGYTPVVVGDGEIVSGINASLAPGMLISGRVTDQETTDPLDNIRVHVDGYDDYYYGAYGRTDANGVYTATPGLPARTYRVSFEDYSDVYADEYYSDTYHYSQAMPVVLTSADLTGIDASLTRGATIVGDVTGPGAIPLDDVEIDVFHTDEYWNTHTTTTDENGHYFLGGMPPIAYKLSFQDISGQHLEEWYQDQADWDSADPVALTSNVTTTIDVELSPAGVIAGVVTAEGSGAPLDNVDVNVYEASSGDYVDDDPTDASGVYQIGGLEPGSYKLEFYDLNNTHLSEWYDDKPDKDSADPIAVTAGVTTTVNAQLATAGFVAGTVTAEGSGAPLNNVSVNIYNAANHYLGYDMTDASGAYSIGGLASGDYKLSFYDDNGVYITEYYDDQPDLGSADLFSVTQGMTTTINAQLAPGGVISGVVTAEGSGAPLDDISVSLTEASTGSYISGHDTDASGAYRFGGLAAGNYKVYFYDYGGVYLGEYYDDKPDWDSADPVAVTVGLTSTANAQLALAGMISGVVTAEGSGAPLGDIDVDAYEASTGNYVNDGETDASGVYWIGGLAPGDYKLRFRDTNAVYLTEYYDDKPSLNSGDSVSVSAGMTSTANAQLTLGGVVNGIITAEGSGAPLDDVDVNVYEASSGDYVSDGDTDASGAYRISRIPTGSYKLYIRDFNSVYLSEWYDDKPDSDSADTFTVTAGMTTTLNAQLALGGVISGVVTAQDSGLPLSDVDVDVYEASTGNWQDDDTTDASGVYRVGSLETGDYKLRFYDLNGGYVTEYYADKPDKDSADPVAVTAGLTTTVNAQLAPGGVISGVVVAEGSGAPLDNVDVDVYDASTGNRVNSDTTDASGAYRVGGLATGNYKVRFYDYDGIYQVEYYDDKPDYDSADPIAVTAGTTTTANAQLALGGVINGTVTDEDGGAPLEDITVRIYEASTGNYVKRDTTDASGAYRIGGLRDNSYKLHCEDYGGQYLSEWYQDEWNQTMADPIAVSADVTTTINVALARGGIVTGRVTDADSGAGIASVSAQARRYDASISNRSSSTDANGYYTITALYTGVYQVTFYPPRPYLGQRYDGFRIGSGVDLITVSAPLTTTGINAALHKGYYISGTVTSGSAPLSGVYVRAYSGDSTSYSASYNTGSDGLYWLGPLDPNYYRVQFKPSNTYAIEWYDDSASYDGSTPLHLSGDLGDVNADLAAGGSITGRVTGSGGAPLADLWVYVYPAGHNNSLLSVRTDDDGYYATPDVLSTGQYQVDFSAPLGYHEEWYDNKSSQSSATLVSVVAGQTTSNVNAQLTAYAHGTLMGTVTAADTGLPLSMWVYAYSDSGLGTWSRYADGGSFVLEGLPPDAYRVKYNSPPYPYIFGYYHDQADWDSADLVTVTAGVTTSLQVQALPVGGSISGTVTGPGGSLPGVQVYVQRVVGSYLSNYTYTGVDGGYYVPELGAGEYIVQFTPPSPFIREWYDDAPNWGASNNVTVTLGATTPHVDAVVEVGGVITGLITAADTGAPLPGAYVNVYSTTGSLVRDYAYAHADGLYQTPGLPAGTYQVLFQVGPWNRYIAEWYDDAPPSSVHVTVTVPVAGVTPNINAALDQGGSISGWTYNALKGLPMRSVRARVYDAVSGSYLRYDYSNNGGLYQVNGLPSGQYKVFFNEGGFESQWYSQTLDQASALTVTVNAPEDVPNINAYLEYMYGVYLPVMLRSAP